MYPFSLMSRSCVPAVLLAALALVVAGCASDSIEGDSSGGGAERQGAVTPGDMMQGFDQDGFDCDRLADLPLSPLDASYSFEPPYFSAMTVELGCRWNSSPDAGFLSLHLYDDDSIDDEFTRDAYEALDSYEALSAFTVGGLLLQEHELEDVLSEPLDDAGPWDLGVLIAGDEVQPEVVIALAAKSPGDGVQRLRCQFTTHPPETASIAEAMAIAGDLAPDVVDVCNSIVAEMA